MRSSCFQDLVSHAATRSQELQSLEGDLQLVVEKDHRVDQKLQEVAAFRSDLERVKLKQGPECQFLKEQVKQLANDKKTLEERNVSLQEKNKSISRKHKCEFLSLLPFL